MIRPGTADGTGLCAAEAATKEEQEEGGKDGSRGTIGGELLLLLVVDGPRASGGARVREDGEGGDRALSATGVSEALLLLLLSVGEDNVTVEPV